LFRFAVLSLSAENSKSILTYNFSEIYKMTLSAKIPTVSNFLCYFDLSKGGLILGFFDVTVYGLTFLTLVINVLTGFSIIDTEKLNNFTVLGMSHSVINALS
jgi:hypothetical protein